MRKRKPTPKFVYAYIGVHVGVLCHVTIEVAKFGALDFWFSFLVALTTYPYAVIISRDITK